MSTWIFYHSKDLDGKCSAAIAYRALKDRWNKCKLYPIDYGDIFPWDRITEDDIIYMLDFSLEPFLDMVLLAKSCKELIWIDHHSSSIKEMEASKLRFAGVQKIGVGACELAWRYFYPKLDLSTTVYMLSRYDIWDHSWHQTLPFQYYTRSISLDPDNSEWDLIFNMKEDQISKAVKIGESIQSYQKLQDEESTFHTMFDSKLKIKNYENIRVLAANISGKNSQFFDSVWNEDQYDIMLTFYWSPKGHWYISMYTTKEDVNVGEIAKSQGGGGHNKAAGFQIKDINNVLELI